MTAVLPVSPKAQKSEGKTVLSSRTRTRTRSARGEETTSRLYPKGRPIRISSHVYNVLEKKRQKAETGLSWDGFLRLVFGLPLKRGNSSSLFEGWLLKSTGEFFPSLAKARGRAVRNAGKNHALGPAGIEKPIKVREVV